MTKTLARSQGILVLIGLLVLWDMAARLVQSPFVPSLSAVFQAGLTALTNGSLGENYLASLSRVLIGFAIGAGLGLATGTVLGVFRIADRIAGPLVIAFRQIPLFGLVPLLGLWFGIGETAKIVLVSVATFYPVALNTQDGLRGVPQRYRDVAAAFTFSRWQAIRHVLLPGALPAILTGLKHGLSFAWIAVVAAELFLAAAPGLGNILTAGRAQSRMDLVLLGVFLVGGTGYALTLAMAVLEKRLLRWRRVFS